MWLLKGAIGFVVVALVSYFFQKGQTYWAAFVVSMPWNTLLAFSMLGFDSNRTNQKAEELAMRTAFGLLATAAFGFAIAFALKRFEFWTSLGIGLAVLAIAHTGVRYLVLKGAI